MRVKEWIALPAAVLLAGGLAAAQTTSPAPTQPEPAPQAPPAATPAQVSQGIAGPVNPTKPALKAQEDALKAQEDALKTREDALKAQQEAKSRSEKDKARYQDMVRAGYAPVNSFYPGGSTYPYLAFFQQSPRFSALTRPVDVRFDHATVHQVAETLTKASGVTVLADPSVPGDIRLTVDARGVPLATVLDAIANQAHLLIAPLTDTPAGKTAARTGAGGTPTLPTLQTGGADAAPDHPVASSAGTVLWDATATPLAAAPQIQGVILKSEPSLKVGDNPRINFSSPTAPWSEEWFKSARPLPQFNANMQENRAGRDYVVVRNPFGGYGNSPSADMASSFAAVTPGSFAIAALGEHELVVAEPAPNGEPAVLLSVYRLENGQLRRVSVFLHHLAVGKSSAARRPNTGNTASEPPRSIGAVPPAQPEQPGQPSQRSQASPGASPDAEAK